MHTMITHIGVYATDIERSKDFYCHYFNGTCGTKYVNNKGFSSYFITFSSGARLEIMAHQDLEIRVPLEKVNGWSHVAFSVGSQEEVITLTNRLIHDGYELLSPPRHTGDGYFESCVGDPDGNRIEITE